MMIRIATFNVDNLFNRPKVMNEQDWTKYQPVINDSNRLTELLNQETYSADDKAEILALLKKYGLDKSRPNNKFLELRIFRGKLLKFPKGKPVEVVADGRAGWIGWVELKKDPIEDPAIENTARVIADVNPDVIMMVEVENRPALLRFYESILKPQMDKKGQQPYDHIMVIPGRDLRGINVGIMSRYPIKSMVSHVDDMTDDGIAVFSRDCPEYYLDLGNGETIVVMPNHFASQGSDLNGKRRRVQAAAVRDIYGTVSRTFNNVVIGGDLNQPPEKDGALDPLLVGTNLKDAMSLDVYHGLAGTYKHGNTSEKLDYLLLSPALAAKVTAVDLNRRGYYSPEKWVSYENITAKTKDRFFASDHHCLWADISL